MSIAGMGQWKTNSTKRLTTTIKFRIRGFASSQLIVVLPQTVQFLPSQQIGTQQCNDL